MSDVVVVAQLAEGIPATHRTALIADLRSAVSAFSHSRLSAGHTYVAVSGYYAIQPAEVLVVGYFETRPGQNR